MRVILYLIKSVLKVIFIIAIILSIWFIVCIIRANGLTGSWTIFINSTLVHLIIMWGALVIGCFKEGDLQHILLGILIFYIPIIIIGMSTPDPGIELFDNQGNIWTLTKK